MPPHPALAQGKVRHVGDLVAFVTADTLATARDVAAAVAVDYASLARQQRAKCAGGWCACCWRLVRLL